MTDFSFNGDIYTIHEEENEIFVIKDANGAETSRHTSQEQLHLHLFGVLEYC